MKGRRNKAKRAARLQAEAEVAAQIDAGATNSNADAEEQTGGDEEASGDGDGGWDGWGLSWRLAGSVLLGGRRHGSRKALTSGVGAETETGGTASSSADGVSDAVSVADFHSYCLLHLASRLHADRSAADICGNASLWPLVDGAQCDDSAVAWVGVALGVAGDRQQQYANSPPKQRFVNDNRAGGTGRKQAKKCYAEHWMLSAADSSE